MSTAAELSHVNRQDIATRRYRHNQRHADRNCGPIPAVADLKRRESTYLSFPNFCETYFPNNFQLPWSPNHYAASERIEDATLRGGLFAFVMPRGTGKTTICEWAALWALCHAHQHYVVLVGASETAAEARLKSIRIELITNPLLLADFPEVCHPFVELGAAWRQAENQHVDGELTAITWNRSKLVFPTVRDNDGEYHATSGSVLEVKGITGEIRGMNHKKQNGETIRPGLAICDDPQTRTSAKSPTQSETRAATIAADVAYLSGPGKPISVLVPCTVIYTDDLAHRLTNRDLHPEYRGIHTKMVNSFPKNMELWDKYAELLKDSLRNDGDGSEATEFYRENQAEMDLGAEVTWPERFSEHELSAIQHAMNLKIRDEAAFWSEMQGEPIEVQGDNEIAATPAEILAKMNAYPRYSCPKDTTAVTAFIDPKMNALYYAVVAWGPGFVGQVIDYGVWPDQENRARTLSSADLRRTYETELGGFDAQKQTYQALKALCSKLKLAPYEIDGGGELHCSRILVDANLGPITNTIYQFCRENSTFFPVLPSHGRYVGASSQSWSVMKRKRGERVGIHWRERPSEEWPIRHVVFDTNFWKTAIHTFFKAEQGGSQTIGLFGIAANGRRLEQRYHTEFADQVCAEFPLKVECKGKTVYEWRLKGGRPDNDMLDCMVGCAVAASMEGIEGETAKSPRKRMRKTVDAMKTHMESVKRWQNQS